MDFMVILEKFGFPALVICAGGFALWRIATWFGEHVATPLVASHVGLVETIKNNDTINCQTLAKMSSLVKEIADIQADQNQMLKDISASSASAAASSAAAARAASA